MIGICAYCATYSLRRFQSTTAYHHERFVNLERLDYNSRFKFCCCFWLFNGEEKAQGWAATIWWELNVKLDGNLSGFSNVVNSALKQLSVSSLCDNEHTVLFTKNKWISKREKTITDYWMCTSEMYTAELKQDYTLFGSERETWRHAGSKIRKSGTCGSLCLQVDYGRWGAPDFGKTKQSILADCSTCP